jgi:rhamnosyltransferase
MPEVACVIPTYRPQASALRSLIGHLTTQGVPTIVSDDASPVTADPILRAAGALGVQVVRHRSNAGIARGLNEGLVFARAQGARWLLTVDQDSVLPAHHIADLLRAAHARPDIGVVGVETISDATGELTYPTTLDDGLLATDEVFQTGSLWRVSALDSIGGFDERLGIDAVDAAACLRLREHGLRVVLAPGTVLDHHYGAGRPVRILGRTIIATGHSPARRETMVRNRLALAPAEFRRSPRHALRTLRRVGVNLALAATVEEDRLAKLAGGLRGLLPRR